MSPALFNLFVNALWETLLMVGVSGLFTLLIGGPLAIVLVTTGPRGIFQARALNAVLGAVVNGFRSTPFIILLVALIPVTRYLVGTTIGIWAAIVPLSIAAIPFYARIAEVSFREVDSGLIEAAQAMGASRLQIISSVMIPEALPGLVAGFTITLISLISSSAMAGAVGAGGLGDLAIRYGYQRFETTVMIAVIAVLIAIVMIVQGTGDFLARRLNKR